MKTNIKIASGLFAFLSLTNQMPAMDISSDEIQETYNNWTAAQLLQMGKNFMEARNINKKIDIIGKTIVRKDVFPPYYSQGSLEFESGKSPEDYYNEFKESNKLLPLAFAARMGLKDAQFRLAQDHFHRHMRDESIMRMYESPDNFIVAFYLFTEAANRGHPYAQCALGQFYFHGVFYYSTSPILAPDLSKALTYFESAVIHHIPEAHYMLGRLYEEGDVIARDMEKAISNYKIAAQGEDNRAGKKEAIQRLKELENVTA